jgi:cobalt-zinc-cadmium efflux system outer membrane protein
MKLFAPRRPEFILKAFVAAFVLSVSCMGQTAPLTVTLAQAVEMARQKNPTLLAAREHMQAVHANEITAGLRQNPELALTGSEVTLGANNPASPYTYSANVSRLFERGQKRRWRLDSTRAYSLQADAQYNDLERQTLLDVKQNFVQVLQSKAALEVAKEDLDSWNHTIDLSKRRLDAGDMSGTDFARIDLQLAQFESDYDNAVLNLRQNSDQLQLALGIEHPAPEFQIVGDLRAPAMTHTLTEIEALALKNRPDLLAAQHLVDATAADHHLAVANGTTDPTLAGEYERVATYNSFGFSVSIPLRIFDRNQGEKQRTELENSASRYALAAAHNQVISDIDQAWAAYLSSAHLAARYNDHYLNEATQIRDNLEFSFQHGGATLLDFLDAQRDFRQIQLNTINANTQVWLSIHQLSFAADTEMLP